MYNCSYCFYRVNLEKKIRNIFFSILFLVINILQFEVILKTKKNQVSKTRSYSSGRVACGVQRYVVKNCRNQQKIYAEP